MTEREAYDQLAADYGSSGDFNFILQHVVDAFAAQQATRESKPITVFFALAGLCLRVEKRASGRTVQHIHQLLAQRKQVWPVFDIPASRGPITAADVVAKPVGPERDAAVDRWCEAVWESYRSSQERVRQELRARGIETGDACASNHG
jgi:hypothetical protein